MLKIYQLRLKQNTFDVTLKYKGVSVRVAFVDGNTYNGTPAKCYTNNPFKQKAIENSQMYKNREIVLERVVEEKEEPKTVTKAQTVKRAANKQHTGPVAKAGKVAETKVKTKAEAKKETETETSTETKVEAETAADDGGEKKMTFDNLAEAIQFIATNYQEQVMTANEARNFLKNKGIKATIKNG